ncbi:hypothetical protein K505DRAFT_344531 [Melanomma pulvis-pyrius CBS 109.77]|uniref:Uncharacterized protein n=1 Tax=Melanomma pulvis-pyrius CBS 109.77 TaxID=1314802 RepID=A0A6A6WNW7_9PLEO|nr:hypothetical protein K505DRAFT_344531 [Melanomma pulvis-pyrius CBS 109.77]
MAGNVLNRQRSNTQDDLAEATQCLKSCTKLAVRSGSVVKSMEKRVVKSEDTREELQLKVYRTVSAIAFTPYYAKRAPSSERADPGETSNREEPLLAARSVVDQPWLKGLHPPLSLNDCISHFTSNGLSQLEKMSTALPRIDVKVPYPRVDSRGQWILYFVPFPQKAKMACDVLGKIWSSLK